MRLLIGNDLDDSLLRKIDVRAWAQRILWFAEDGDAVVLMDEPDPAFVEHVTGLTGVDKSTLRFLVLPGGGRFERRMFDHHQLLDEEFLSCARTELAGVDRVLALWHSPLVQVFLEEIGLGELWPGGPLYAQNGAECLNSMGNFRVFARGARVPIADGTVCRTIDDAVLLTSRLLERYPAVMVKKAHGGAGAGNLLLTTDRTLDGEGSGNARRVEILQADAAELRRFWEDHWEWASAHGRYPVVIEQYFAGARSLYVEFHLDERGPTVNEIGELQFEGRRQVREVVPVRSLETRLRTKLVDAAHALASYYHRLGHRGFLSTDAVVYGAGRFAFTEVNAQFTGSSHLYGVVSNRVVRAWERGLTVTQLASPDEWSLSDLSQLITVLREERLDFAAGRNECVIPITPCIGEQGIAILAIVHAEDGSIGDVLDKVGSALARSSR